MSLQVINPGFCTLVQDFGRFGKQKYGFTNGGPMDEHAFLWANKLLGNDYNCSQLEICMGGFSAEFLKETIISVCGADGKVTLNNHVISSWQTHRVKSGDVIRIDGFVKGLYSYLAIQNGFQIDSQLGSCSTVMREKLGGTSQNGTPLQSKAELNYQANSQYFSSIIPNEYNPNIKDKVTLRFIPNTSETGCHDSAIQSFIEQTYTVGSEINRMGYRLKGKKIKIENEGIISQGIGLGTIQLPKDGQPIVLMKDRQTIGGYPQLGCVAYLDLSKLSQSKPGTKINFQIAEIDQITEELNAYLDFFEVQYCS